MDVIANQCMQQNSHFSCLCYQKSSGEIKVEGMPIYHLPHHRSDVFTATYWTV